MSLHQLAQKLAAQGRGGDTMLAHINAEEAGILKLLGGSGTINPKTGLPEFFGIKTFTRPFTDAGKSVGIDLGDLAGSGKEAIKDIRGSVSSILDDLGPYAPLVLGAMLGPAGYGLSAMGAGLTVGATYGIANGSLKSGLRAGLSAGSGANIAQGISSLSSGSATGAPYSDGGRLLKGPGDGVSDSIPATIGRKQQPARLADGEFVIPARIVSEVG
jgi:hypothetical protein